MEGTKTENEKVEAGSLDDHKSPPFPPTKFFGRDVRRYLSLKYRAQKQPDDDDDDSKDTKTVEELPCSLLAIDFDDTILRQVLEPHIAKARQRRAKAMAAV
eukprot:scaffold29070_cov76-Amphora_coffeaeformis.AAC.1